jgi:hypothetical protein
MSYKLVDLRCTKCGTEIKDVLVERDAAPEPEQKCCEGPWTEILGVPSQRKHSSWEVDGVSNER